MRTHRLEIPLKALTADVTKTVKNLTATNNHFRFIYVFLGMEADVITSCCGGSLFSSEKKEGLGSEIASLPAIPMMWTFYVAMAITLSSGLYFW
jgi:hypothetical protein